VASAGERPGREDGRTLTRLASESIKLQRRALKASRILASGRAPATATTPNDVVFEKDNLKLRHYHPVPGAHARKRTPVLVCYALVNKPSILDLQQDRSVVRRLLEAGLDVYLIDWGTPDEGDKFLTIDDYVNRYIDQCVDFVREESEEEEITLFGYCMGGTLSAIYACLHHEKLRNLVIMAAGIDFHQGCGLLNYWAKFLDIDKLVDTWGNVPAGFLNSGFLLLDPARNAYGKYVGLLDLVDDEAAIDNFLRMERWVNDGIPVAGETYREFLKKGYQENALVKGEWEVGGVRVDLKTLKMPILTITASADTIMPAETTEVLTRLTSSKDVESLTNPGGHIGLAVSSRAHRELWPKAAAWMIERSR
jgi:polyhydroxyalkanoate synthase